MFKPRQRQSRFARSSGALTDVLIGFGELCSQVLNRFIKFINLAAKSASLRCSSCSYPDRSIAFVLGLVASVAERLSVFRIKRKFWMRGFRLYVVRVQVVLGAAINALLIPFLYFARPFGKLGLVFHMFFRVINAELYQKVFGRVSP